MAAAVEQDAEHPVARAVVASAAERRLGVPRVTLFEAIPGYGVEASLDGRRLSVGGPNLLRRDRITLPAELDTFSTDSAARGQGVVYLIEAGQAVAAFAVADAAGPSRPRPYGSFTRRASRSSC